jgi:Flp pilus assembly protein TadG
MNGDDPMSLRIRQAIRRFLVGEDGIAGTALIEFTLLAPLLVVTSVYTMDYGLLFYRQMQVQNAAQAGVDWAMANHIFNRNAITAAVTNATNYTDITLPTNALNPPSPNPNPVEWCGCPTSTGVTPQPTPLTSYTGGTCPTTCGASVGLYVTVQTQAVYNSFIRFGPLFSGTRTLNAQATARIQ